MIKQKRRFCFPDEHTAKQVLSQYRVQTEEGEDWNIGNHEHNLVVVGDLYDDPVLDAEGEVIVPPVKLEGFHINLKAVSIPDGAEIYRREPKNAKVKWSGE